jgi:hypothetical protein
MWTQSCPSGGRDRTPVRRTTVVRRPELRRLDTDRQVDSDIAGREATAAGAASDCASPLCRPRGRLHTPPEAARREDRERTCTTTLRREHANRFEQSAQTRPGRGCARSSGETVPALGPASFQNGTPATGAHPGAEAVLLGTLQIVRLVGAFQRKPPGRAATTAAEIRGCRGRRGEARARTTQGYGL